jgi:hypothetical protein
MPQPSPTPLRITPTPTDQWITAPAASGVHTGSAGVSSAPACRPAGRVRSAQAGGGSSNRRRTSPRPLLEITFGIPLDRSQVRTGSADVSSAPVYRPAPPPTTAPLTPLLISPAPKGAADSAQGQPSLSSVAHRAKEEASARRPWVMRQPSKKQTHDSDKPHAHQQRLQPAPISKATSNLTYSG